MSKPHNPSRTRRNTALVVVLTAGLLALFLWNVDLPGLSRALRRAHAGQLAIALAFTAVTYVFRAWRWQALLQPIGGTTFRNAFRITVIGFTASNLLFGRVGEVLRPYLLARKERLSATATFATIIIERMLDMASVVLLLAVFLWTQKSSSGSSGDLEKVRISAAVAAALAFAGLSLLFVCAGHPERLARLVGRATSRLPASAGAAATKLVKLFAEGLAVMRHPGPLVRAFGLSLPMWLSIGAGIWFTSRAFDLTFPFAGAFLIMNFLVLGVAVPTPAGIGGFHFAYKMAVTTYFAADADTAVAAATALHAVSFLPVTVFGLIFIRQDGLTLTNLRNMGQTAERAEGLTEGGAS